MKKDNITVNGNTYEVAVEEIGGVPAVVPAQVPAAASAAAPAVPAAPAPAAAAPPSSGASAIESPMPGTIVSIQKKPGDAVADGEVVLILEAMKMENEIVAPCTGTIDVISVTKGTPVNAGDLLFSIK